MTFSFLISDITNFFLSPCSPVNVPMGGISEVYTSLEERRKFSYANVRKAAYRGNNISMNGSDH